MLSPAQKLSLILLATITLEVVPLRAYETFPVFLPFLEFFLEAVYCEGAEQRLQFDSITSSGSKLSSIR
jgi:hypothetical protein